MTGRPVTDCADDICCTPATDKPFVEATAPKRRVQAPFIRIAVSGLAIVAGFAAGLAGAPIVSLAGYLLAIAVSAASPVLRATRAIGKGVLDINVLMVVAVIGAGVLGDWLEAAVVIWLFAIAEWLEAASLDRARHAIRALMTLAPVEALVRRDGRECLAPVASIRVGEIFIVRPGERVALDGRVVSGESAHDESPVTGESWPVDKAPGDEVRAGAINGSGALEVRAERPATDSTIARIVRLVEHAQAARAPVQVTVDRFARRYTPAVAVLALGLAVVPPLVSGGAVSIWVYRALALLVVACPCALVISTPVSIVSGLTAGARAGVLIKGGAHLQRLGSVRCVAFDKTGTLTDAGVTVIDVLGVNGVTRHGVLSVAAALESRSEHPIGRAIVSQAHADGVAVDPGEAFRALPGFGAEARVAAAPAVVGSHRLFEQRHLCTPALHDCIDALRHRGATSVLVSHGGSALGAIGLAGQVRHGGREALASLRAEGVGHLVLLTGDSRATADAVAHAAGLDETHADLLPADKVAAVDELRRRHGVVAMVGDGVNDAPALAAADVGIAMGAGGSDVALEAADVALMGDDLSKLPFAVRLGRATVRNIRANITVAVGLKLVFIGLAAAGVATLWMAILADTGASLLVTANSLRLLRLRA